jgi:hypothetical protein
MIVLLWIVFLVIPGWTMFHVNSARSITPPKIPSANLNVWIINKFLTLFGSPYVIIGNSKVVTWGGCTFHNTYEYTWVHKRDIYYFKLSRTIYTHATQIITHSFVHVQRTSGKYATFVLVWYGHLLRLIYLEVWRRTRSMIEITNWLMIPVHKVVTKENCSVW